ncbi:hypothetical protein [Neorhizobium alkalisoli]|uniref:Uncharacterized protein n=1 Tax=Neorhizobium alkalisoli TaxID=528178 RepID=A0A561PST0_9HYPH|nr:hypothetical protein [Neorhizobium alkalisoli]TWF41179.1 hypothetical protein FHW37_1284 [Neorhizobium alkalisoli]
MYTVEKLKAMTLEERDTVYRNCLRNPGPKADEILLLLEKTGEKYIKDKPVANGDPIYRAIELIINKPEHTDLMLDATAKSRPALEPIDPLIANALGKDYGGHNETTILAGYLVGQRMYALGYEKRPAKTLTGCVAKTAATFRKKKGA